jgi:hypothetical protein
LARRKIIPSAFMVPEFGKYIEEGATGNVPSPTGRVKFTASQSRHWLEYGTAVMESIFADKALHPFSNAAARYEARCTAPRLSTLATLHSCFPHSMPRYLPPGRVRGGARCEPITHVCPLHVTSLATC